MFYFCYDRILQKCAWAATAGTGTKFKQREIFYIESDGNSGGSKTPGMQDPESGAVFTESTHIKNVFK